MAVSKLSQIANSSGNIPSTGVIVGVDQAGPTDLLFTPGQISGLTMAGGSLTFYQNYATGSDSNNGTAVGTPFKTMQHAFYVSAGYNYSGGFFPTINMAAQTDTETNDNSSQIFVPPLFPAGTQGTVQGAGVGSTAMSDTDGWGVFFLTLSSWFFDGLTIDSSFIAFSISGAGADLGIGTLTITDSTNSGNLTPFSTTFNAIANLGFSTLTIGGSTLTTLLHVFNNSFVQTSGMTLNLPASLACTFSFLECEFESAIQYHPASVTNAGGVTGPAVFMASNCAIATPNGLLSDVPGVASSSQFDASCAIVSDITGFTGGAGFATVGSSRGRVDTSINTQTGSYALALTDAGNRVEINDALASTLTVPTNASVAFPIGTEVRVTQFGVGVVTIAGAGGVTVDNAGVLTQWGTALLYKRGTNEWVLTAVQAGAAMQASGNLTYYVATTGNDSNPGTIGSPFLTLGRAMLAVGNTDYQNLYSWTINVADGTYSADTGANWITPANAVNLPLGGGHIIGNHASPGNVVFNNLNNGFVHNGPYQLLIDGFQFENSGFMPALFLAGGGGAGVASNGNGCGILYSNFNLVTNNANFGHIFQAGAGALIDDANTPVVVNLSGTHSQFGAVFTGDAGAQFNCDGGVTINTSGSWTTATNWISLSGAASIVFQPAAVTGVVSAGLGEAFNFAVIVTLNGAVTDFPGVTSLGTFFVDSTVYWTNFVVGSYIAQSFSTFTGPSPIPSWAGFFDATNSIPYMGASDGTNTFFNSLSTSYKISVPSSGGTVTSSAGLRSNILNPASTLATLTVNLPTGVKNAYTTRISTSQTITAITFATTDSSAIVGAPSTLVLGSAVQFLFDPSVGANGTWYIN